MPKYNLIDITKHLESIIELYEQINPKWKNITSTMDEATKYMLKEEAYNYGGYCMAINTLDKLK